MSPTPPPPVPRQRTRFIPRRRAAAYGWIPLLAAGLFFVAWTSELRIRHLTDITGAAGGAPVIDASSATGYAGAARALIVPAHDRESYEWIAQIQEMLHRGTARIHQISYENVPYGREVRAASPCRWWLAGVARIIHLVSGLPLGAGVERAALYRGPLEYLLLLVGVTVFAAWRFGSLAAAAAAMTTSALFPLGASFLPGVLNERTFAVVVAIASILLLLPAIEHIYSNAATPVPNAARWRSSSARWAAAAGAAGGLGLWNDPSVQLPVLLGIAMAGLLLAWRRESDGTTTMGRTFWRVWALTGAGVIVAGFLTEYFPDGLRRWDLDRVHPLFGIAWLGAAELIVQVGAPPAKAAPSARRRRFAVAAIALLLFAAPALAQWFAGASGLFHVGSSSHPLTKLPDGLSGSVLQVLIARGWLDPQLLAAFAPVLLLVPACWTALRPSTRASDRASLAVCVLPALAALGFSFAYLDRWQIFDGVLIVVVVASARIWSRSARPIGPMFSILALALVLVPGLARLWPASATARNTAPVLEVEETIERDLARWLARRGGENVVAWAPPELTSALYFYGSVRGVGTYAPENRTGLAAALQLARSGSDEEALARIRQRGITHLVIPSWEGFFGPDAATADARPGEFIGHVRTGVTPPWLHPVWYPVTRVAGLDEHSATVFDVVDDQDEPLTLSRFTEYLIEADELDRAALIAASLERFPSDVASLTARIEVAAARRDQPDHDRAITALRAQLARGADRYLPWDRRVSLAITLAREKDLENTLAQLRRCLDGVTDARLRFLSPKTLFDFQRLATLLELRITDPKLETLARGLLPPDLRRRLEPR